MHKIHTHTNLAKSQIPRDADRAVALDHVVSRDNNMAAMCEMAQPVRMPRYQWRALDHLTSRYWVIPAERLVECKKEKGLICWKRTTVNEKWKIVQVNNKFVFEVLFKRLYNWYSFGKNHKKREPIPVKTKLCWARWKVFFTKNPARGYKICIIYKIRKNHLSNCIRPSSLIHCVIILASSWK
jgi:hypothetical protein